MVHDIRDGDTLGEQLLTFRLQGCYRAGLKGKMIERAGNAEPGVNTGIIVLRNPLYLLRLHESDELIPTCVKEDVPDLPPFGNLDNVTASDLEPQDVLVKVTRAVQIPCR